MGQVRAKHPIPPLAPSRKRLLRARGGSVSGDRRGSSWSPAGSRQQDAMSAPQTSGLLPGGPWGCPSRVAVAPPAAATRPHALTVRVAVACAPGFTWGQTFLLPLDTPPPNIQDTSRSPAPIEDGARVSVGGEQCRKPTRPLCSEGLGGSSPRAPHPKSSGC